MGITAAGTPAAGISAVASAAERAACEASGRIAAGTSAIKRVAQLWERGKSAKKDSEQTSWGTNA